MQLRGLVAIGLASGSVLTFLDDTTEGDRYVRRSYEGGVSGTDFVAVRETYYEGWRYLLVHAATGRVTALPDAPIVSPDGRRLLVASGDLEAGYVPNVLQVWRIERDTMTAELEIETAAFAVGQGWAASSPRWISDGVAVAYRRFLQRGIPAADSSMVWIVRHGARWTVEDHPPDA